MELVLIQCRITKLKWFVAVQWVKLGEILANLALDHDLVRYIFIILSFLMENSNITDIHYILIRGIPRLVWNSARTNSKSND